MKFPFGLLSAALLLLALSACSTIKSWFPDKEKDYQFTTEIPPLTLPSDLSGGSLRGLSGSDSSTASKSSSESGRQTVITDSETEEEETVPAYTPAPEDPDELPDIDRKTITVTLDDAEQGAKRLHISAPIRLAWRLVGKALSRNSIEVTDRNQTERVFQVQYSPDKPVTEEEGSFWEEVTFVLKGLNVKEYEYDLKLVESGRQTDVIVLDKEQQPVSEPASLSLLMLLYDTIKADLAS